MLDIQPTDIDGGVILRIKGDITERDIEKIHHLLTLKNNVGDQVNLLIDFDEWKGTSFSEFIEEIKLPRFNTYFNKVALIANTNWIKEDTTSDHMLPGVPMKQYEPSEREEAEAWLDAGAH